MRVSTRTRYGVRAMMALAVRHGSGPTSVREIAEDQELPLKYLEQLVSSLRAAKLVRSQRGIGGGYVLARAPEEITVADIYTSLEGPMTPVDCLADPDSCSRVAICATRDVWDRAGAAMMEVLSSTTLADLARDSEERCRIGRPGTSADSAAL